MNTRATYSINQKQFTHYELREEALTKKQSQAVGPSRSIWLWVIVGIICAMSVTSCDFSYDVSINTPSTIDTQSN